MEGMMMYLYPFLYIAIQLVRLIMLLVHNSMQQKQMGIIAPPQQRLTMQIVLS
jgi:hypothetical protein